MTENCTQTTLLPEKHPRGHGYHRDPMYITLMVWQLNLTTPLTYHSQFHYFRRQESSPVLSLIPTSSYLTLVSTALSATPKSLYKDLTKYGSHLVNISRYSLPRGNLGVIHLISHVDKDSRQLGGIEALV